MLHDDGVVIDRICLRLVCSILSPLGLVSLRRLAMALGGVSSNLDKLMYCVSIT
ncbi:hypothetical protein ACHAXH_009292, partial [Discostella pseudostelligera]